jgi:predicted dehydrogenase
MFPRRVTRRSFLTTVAGSAAVAGGPWVVPSRVMGKGAPSNTLRLGCIGTGRMGHGDMAECLSQGLNPSTAARIVAVCDVDRHRATHAKRVVEETYAELLSEHHPPRTFSDYRELLARDDIDGVTISVPDHWHALIAIAAAEAGKDIYLQKPLTHTIVEGQKLVEAVRRNGVILQVGSQQRSSGDFRRACELVRNGFLGKLHTIEVRLPADSGTGDATPMAVPKNFDFDRWLGPTPEVPYAQDRVHPQQGFSRPGWLQIESYCRGMITGWGAHMFDIAQWGHGSDDTGLVEMQATAEFPSRGLFNVHTAFHAEGRYADGVRLFAQTDARAGVKFIGEKGWIDVGRGYLGAQPRTILDEPLGDDSVRLYRSDHHMRNFLHSMRTREEPICPVEVGHRSNTICVITHIAMKLGRKLRWNPECERFIDDNTANRMLDYPHREPWGV